VSGDAVDSPTLLQCSSFGNSVAVHRLWQQHGGGFSNNVAVALAIAWQCSSFANTVAVQRRQRGDAAALPTAVTLSEMETTSWAVVAAAAAAA